jgi:hypothetical protein
MADYYAVIVNLAGNIFRRSDRGITANRVAAGVYDVTFPEDVDDWMRQATVGAVDDTDQLAGIATTQLGAMGVPDTLRVKTFDDAGMATDKPFHLEARRVRR